VQEGYVEDLEEEIDAEWFSPWELFPATRLVVHFGDGLRINGRRVDRIQVFGLKGKSKLDFIYVVSSSREEKT
jgi:hypothetical protein